MADIHPFTLAVPQEQLDDLHRRLDATRWPEKETVTDWSQGTPLAVLQDLMAYWRSEYDWRRCEAHLNSLGQYTTTIDGLDIHFLHIRSQHENATPLIMTHGWPGSVVEFLQTIGPLTAPEAHGGWAEEAFHLVLPSLPGYGFSGKPDVAGKGTQWIARSWAELMRRLGYENWVAQGGDWGAAVTYAIGEDAPAGCLGIHLNMPIGRPPGDLLTEEDHRAAERAAHFRSDGQGYAQQQRTRPQTIGYALVDSPVGLAGWIFEKLQAWSDNDGNVIDLLGCDAILDNIMHYWLTASGASSARLYWESARHLARSKISLPSGFSTFPKEMSPAPRSWVETNVSNIVYWNELGRGGHFAAWEQPVLFVNELRECFALMR